MLQRKAKEFSEALKIEKFEAISGWLFCFYERYGIMWKQISGREKSGMCKRKEKKIWKYNRLFLMLMKLFLSAYTESNYCNKR